MQPDEVMCALRELLDDTVRDYLWSTQSLERHINEAYREFTRRTRLLTDLSTANVAVYSVSASSPSIAVSPLVFDIRRAYDVDSERELCLKNSNTCPVVGIPEGEVRYVIADREKDKLFFQPIPAEDFTLTMQVVRYPLEAFALAGMANPLEYQDEKAWRITLLYAASRAYLKDDVETSDRARSREFFFQFDSEVENYSGDLRNQRRTPGVVQYGGL